MNRSTPGCPVHHQLPEFTQTHVHWVGVAIQPSHPLPSLSPPALSLSEHQGLFKWVSSSHEVAKVLEFQLQHQSFQWTGWIWLDLLAVQGTLKSLLQHHTSKASILRHSVFFTVQFSQTTGKTIALTRRTFVDKVMSTTENQDQESFWPSAPREVSVLPELTLGHLCYCLTGVQPQSNSPPGTVPRVKCSLISSLFTTCFQCLIRSLTYTYHLFYISLSKAFVLSFFICIIPTLSEHKMYIFYSFLYYLCVIFLSYD